MTDEHRCKCGYCKAMSMHRESVCCHDIEEIKSLIERLRLSRAGLWDGIVDWLLLSVDLGNIVGMAFALSHFFAGIPTACIVVPNSFCYETIRLKILTAKERCRCRSFKPILCSFIQPVSISYVVHRHEEICASCILFSLTELQPVAAQRLDMIKLSCKVSTSC